MSGVRLGVNLVLLLLDYTNWRLMYMVYVFILSLGEQGGRLAGRRIPQRGLEDLFRCGSTELVRRTDFGLRESHLEDLFK